MPKILIRNLDNKVILSSDNSATILDIIHGEQIDWMHACGAKGKCTTCKAVIHKGIENLELLSEVERKFLEIGKLKSNERLTCQTQLLTDIEISVAEENKFPHMEYTD